MACPSDVLPMKAFCEINLLLCKCWKDIKHKSWIKEHQSKCFFRSETKVRVMLQNVMLFQKHLIAHQMAAFNAGEIQMIADTYLVMCLARRRQWRGKLCICKLIWTFVLAVFNRKIIYLEEFLCDILICCIYNILWTYQSEIMVYYYKNLLHGSGHALVNFL